MDARTPAPAPAPVIDKTILALDLGTTTGFACGKPGAVISATWNLAPGRFDGGGMRFVKFRARLFELHKSVGFDIVYFEEVRRHVGTTAAHVYGGLMAILTEWCEARAIPYQGVPVGTIKKFATVSKSSPQGKGNADKAAMIAAVRGWGYEPSGDDEADAIALFHYGAVELGAPRPQVH